MSNINGTMHIKQEDYVCQDEVSYAEQPNVITVRVIFFPGTSLPATSGLQENVPISFGPRGSKDTISSLEAHHLTGMSKRDFDTWADSSAPPNVSVSWTFSNQDTPVFTTQFILIRGNPGGCGIVFSQNIDQERNHASHVQHSSIASPDYYTIAIPLQTHTRMACCAACEQRSSARPKRRGAVSDHQCWAAADDGGVTDGWQAAPSMPSGWDAARQASRRAAAQRARGLHADRIYQ